MKRCLFIVISLFCINTIANDFFSTLINRLNSFWDDGSKEMKSDVGRWNEKELEENDNSILLSRMDMNLIHLEKTNSFLSHQVKHNENISWDLKHHIYNSLYLPVDGNSDGDSVCKYFLGNDYISFPKTKKKVKIKGTLTYKVATIRLDPDHQVLFKTGHSISFLEQIKCQKR